MMPARYTFYPVLVLKAGEEYRIWISALDALHGFSIVRGHQNINLEIAPQHAFVHLAGQRIFAFSVPLLDLAGKPMAVLTVYHFTRYLREGVRRELRGLLLSLVTGIIVTAVLVIVIVNRAVTRPIGRLMRKVTALRRGDFPAPGQSAQGPELDLEWPDAEGETANELLFQFQFSIGAHGAHPF